MKPSEYKDTIKLFVDDNNTLNVIYDNINYPLMNINDVKDVEVNVYTELLLDKISDLFVFLNRKNKIKKITKKLND